MTIYLDVVLFENIILNYIIIWSTSIISKSKTTIIRTLLSSLIGGIFAILGYITDVDFLLSLVLRVIISILMMIVAFQNYNFKKIVKELMFFYLVSFTFGGIAFMLLFFINPKNIIISKNHFVGTYPIKVAVLSGGIGFIIINIISVIIKNRLNRKSIICDLEIFYEGKNKKIKTMLDTGNLLKDPISNADVIIVEKDSLKGIVSKDVLDNLTNILNGKWIESSRNNQYKIKLIPFSSLGNDNGMLIGFKPDYIKVYNEEECIRNDVLIGIYDGKLTGNNLYTSLIGLDILKSNI